LCGSVRVVAHLGGLPEVVDHGCEAHTGHTSIATTQLPRARRSMRATSA
jgi:hypothetical protein